jgi:hypothetical protein
MNDKIIKYKIKLYFIYIYIYIYIKFRRGVEELYGLYER